MSAQIAGQSDIFAELGESVPTPPFTVYSCVWAEKGCGWCGAKGMLGGGACRNPEDATESWFYSYCHGCHTLYGSPKVTRPGFPVHVDRTVKSRPGGAVDFAAAVSA